MSLWWLSQLSLLCGVSLHRVSWNHHCSFLCKLHKKWLCKFYKTGKEVDTTTLSIHPTLSIKTPSAYSECHLNDCHSWAYYAKCHGVTTTASYVNNDFANFIRQAKRCGFNFSRWNVSLFDCFNSTGSNMKLRLVFLGFNLTLVNIFYVAFQETLKAHLHVRFQNPISRSVSPLGEQNFFS